MFDFTNTPLWINVAIFAVASSVVWFAGTRITGYANAISVKTGIGQAAIGMLLLGGITSLPEIGATVTSAATGAALLAVNNLFGSIAAQVVILAVIDITIRKALTSEIPDPTVMLQGGLNVLLISIATAGITVGDVSILGIGAWAWATALAYGFSIYVLSQSEGRKAWIAARGGKAETGLDRQQKHAQEEANKEHQDLSLKRVLLFTAGLAGLILVAGFFLSRTADALAEQTGLGGGAMGFVFLAVATSLPEVSTSLTAARAGLYTLAVSDILGTNLINVGLIFVIDAVAPGEPVLSQAGTFAAFGALLGIAVTALFVIGIAERGDKTVLRMGLDSLAVLVCYGAGLVILFMLPGAQ